MAATQQLIEYIRSALASGAERGAVSAALRSSGWEEQDILDGLAAAETGGETLSALEVPPLDLSTGEVRSILSGLHPKKDDPVAEEAKRIEHELERTKNHGRFFMDSRAAAAAKPSSGIADWLVSKKLADSPASANRLLLITAAVAATAAVIVFFLGRLGGGSGNVPPQAIDSTMVSHGL